MLSLARVKRLRRCKHTNDINIKIFNFFNEKDEIKKKKEYCNRIFQKCRIENLKISLALNKFRINKNVD
jgi:hypothetical protein